MAVTLAKFGATWCQACLAMSSIIDEFEEAHPDVHVVRIDVDRSSNLKTKHHIVKIPTMIFFDGAKTVDRINGSCPLERLEEGLEKCGGE